MELQVALPNMTLPPRSYRAQAVESLARFRHDWQEFVEKKSLLEIESPVGLLLQDIAERLELTPQERLVFLGNQLAQEVEEYLNQPLEVTLPQ